MARPQTFTKPKGPMAADDIVDEKALIFTEADVYMIGGYLAEAWGVDGDDSEHTLDIEQAITAVLAEHV